MYFSFFFFFSTLAYTTVYHGLVKEGAATLASLASARVCE